MSDFVEVMTTLEEPNDYINYVINPEVTAANSVAYLLSSFDAPAFYDHPNSASLEDSALNRSILSLLESLFTHVLYSPPVDGTLTIYDVYTETELNIQATMGQLIIFYLDDEGMLSYRKEAKEGLRQLLINGL